MIKHETLYHININVTHFVMGCSREVHQLCQSTPGGCAIAPPMSGLCAHALSPVHAHACSTQFGPVSSHKLSFENHFTALLKNINVGILTNSGLKKMIVSTKLEHST